MGWKLRHWSKLAVALQLRWHMARPGHSSHWTLAVKRGSAKDIALRDAIEREREQAA